MSPTPCDQNIVIHGRQSMSYFLHAHSRFEHTNPMKTIIDRLFRPVAKDDSSSTTLEQLRLICDVTQMRGNAIVTLY